MKTVVLQRICHPWVKSAFQVILGSIALGAAAQISIPLPFSPVPLTLQSLVVGFLALALGSKKAPLAVLFYLFQVTCGLPLLHGGAVNSFWWSGATAGYLFGFLAMAWLIGFLMEKREVSLKWTLTSVMAGWLVLLAMGALGLGALIGMKNGFLLGVLPFLPGEALKIAFLMAVVRKTV